MTIFERLVEVQCEASITVCAGISGINSSSNDLCLFFIHGMGSSKATWHHQVSTLSQYFLIVCPDLRGHGRSSDCRSLSIDDLVSDLETVFSSVQTTFAPNKIVLIGHSVGGCIATFLAHKLAVTKKGLIGGVACLDVAEGTALNSLPQMKLSIKSWPKEFPSVHSCIEWSIRHHHPSNLQSAQVSIPPLLRSTGPDGQYTLKPHLLDYEIDWVSWFRNFNSAFISLNEIHIPHMLLLSSPDRLDTELTTAQMQGKFQLKLIQGGNGEHFLHEDQPDQTLCILVNFMYTSGLIPHSLQSRILSRSFFTTFPTI